MGLPGWLSGKESICQRRRERRHGLNPWVRKTPWRRKWQPTPVLLPGKSHEQQSPAVQSMGSQESQTRQSNEAQYTHIHYIFL